MRQQLDALCAGSFMVDIIATHLPNITPPGGLIYAPNGISINIGGHAANVSIDLAQLGQKSVTAAGCIGNDMLGGYIQRTLKISGVEPSPQILDEIPTAKNISLTVEGEDRRFIAELAANTLLSPDHIINLLKKQPRIFFLGTIGGLKYVDKTLPLILQSARDCHTTTLVDVIPPIEPNWDHLTQALSFIDIIHLNRNEAYLITGISDPKKAVIALRSLGANTIVITSASKGLTALRGETMINMPAFKVNEVDSTGAGDALCAGLIHNLLTLKNPNKSTLDEFQYALLEGQAAGAACVTSSGATTNVKTENIRLLLNEQGDTVLSLSTKSITNID
jgi:sugar/nucleoside kinase (ribokinase family)